MKKYNKFKKRYTELKEGEEFCKTCHGEGMVKSKRAYAGALKKGALLVCKDCLGDGKLDWVECAVGKKLTNPCIEIEKKSIVIKTNSLNGVWTIEN